jgi:hypothetical protein
MGGGGFERNSNFPLRNHQYTFVLLNDEDLKITG